MGGVAPHDRKRVFAACNPSLRGVDLARAQILFDQHGAALQIDQADRIIVIIGDQRARAIGADRDACRLRQHLRPIAGLVMAERDRLADAGEGAAGALFEDMDDIIDPAAHQNARAIGRPGDTRIAVGHGQRLEPGRPLGVDAVAEQILAGLGQDELAVGAVIAVETAGKHQHLASIRAYRDRRRAIRDVCRVGAGARHQRCEARTGRCERGERLPGR
ncbi:hypothetical protein D9M73_119970 [compost metagenome]